MYHCAYMKKFFMSYTLQPEFLAYTFSRPVDTISYFRYLRKGC